MAAPADDWEDEDHLKSILSMQRLFYTNRRNIKRRKYCGGPITPSPAVPPPMPVVVCGIFNFDFEKQ